MCPRCGFVANGSACLWRTMCAATGRWVCGARVRGFVAHAVRRYRVAGSRRTGPRVCGARCAPLQGWGLIPKGGCWGKRAARCLQPAETVAANIVRHGGSLREKRTGPAGTHPPRVCGAQCAPLQGRGFAVHGSAGLWRTLCAATGWRVRGARVRGFVAHAVHRYRAGALFRKADAGANGLRDACNLLRP